VRIAVVGTGYVGLVAGACLAETGNDVACVDLDAAKIARLAAGELPIYEPGLEPLVRQNLEAGRLSFTTDLGAAVRGARVVFIAVGTPAGEDGSADLAHVLQAARVIGRHMDDGTIVVTKSTVPVGTAARVRAAIEGETPRTFHVCSNPEFLKEGAAVEDFMRPDRVVLGVESDVARDVMAEVYAPFTRRGGDRMLFMDIASAEVTKYAANAMLATRISFMNEMAAFCERAGADIMDVRNGIGSDDRIGRAFLYPGPGYGGSCFPKDVKALIRTGDEIGAPLELMRAVEGVNARQKRLLLDRVLALAGPRLDGRVVAVWGLAFKAGTDDMRESSAIPLIEGLLEAGATVQAYDPHAMDQARRFFEDRIVYAADPYAAARGAEALVIVTEWLIFRNPDFARLRGLLRRPLVVDGRNLYNPAKVRADGFEYHGIGRRRV